MPTFTTRRRVAFTPEQMFDLVADVERYPEFLPMCTGLTVLRREERGGLPVLTANMTVGYKSISEQFASRVTLERAERRILVEYLDGPFRRMENRWTFLPAAGGSEVVFYIDYELRSLMLGMLVGAMFDRAFRRFAEAFEARARVVYAASARCAVAGG